MKRIIDGVSYNTETATALGRSEKGELGIETLYQTPAGEFFAVEEKTLSVWSPRSGTYQDRKQTTLTPKSPEAVNRWLADVHTDKVLFYSDRVEAALRTIESRGLIERTTGSATTVYVRMPRSLKERIEAAAAKAKTSVNVWALRAFERVCSEQEQNEKPTSESEERRAK